ncbi:MAG TPA: hypothetical protein VF613_11915 [Longimicrobium sp.]|jgi:hypothetical protein
MTNNVLEARAGANDWVALNALLVGDRDTAGYRLEVDVRSTGEPLRIRASGESLILILDSAQVALRADPGTFRQTRSWTGVRENAVYTAPSGLLRKIAGARHVRVRVLGRKYYLERTMSAANIRRFSEFLSAGGPSQPAAGDSLRYPTSPAPEPLR